MYYQFFIFEYGICKRDNITRGHKATEKRKLKDDNHAATKKHKKRKRDNITPSSQLNNWFNENLGLCPYLVFRLSIYMYDM